MTGWSGAANDAATDRAPPHPPAPHHPDAAAARKLRLRFWLRPVEIQESAAGTVGGLRLERTRLSESGEFEGTGEFETLDAQLVLRSVGYQSVPLPGVPFDPESHTVPERRRPRPVRDRRAAARRVRGGLAQARPDRRHRHQQGRRGRDRPGPAGRPGRRPGPGRDHAAPPRPAPPARSAPAAAGRWPPGRRHAAAAADLADPDVDSALGLADAAAAAGDTAGAEAAAEVASDWALAALLAARGVHHVTYEAWLRVSAAEEELARSLGRGDRVKLPHRDAVWSAARG